MPSTKGLFAEYAPAPLNDAAVPPFPGREADEEDESANEGIQLDFECPADAWAPVPPQDPGADMPVRFIDGSIASKTAGFIVVGMRRRPLIAATVAAAALQFDGRALKREEGVRVLKILCLYSNGIGEQALEEARAMLGRIGVKLRTSEAAAPHADFDSMRRATRSIAMRAMEEAEQQAMLADRETPTLIDGLLERRLAAQKQDVPVVGLVKRQMATYLPLHLQEMVYALKPGERTPAFVLETVQHVALVNTYIRLSSEAGTSPSYGIVRLTVPIEYVRRAHSHDLGTYLSGLAGYLYRLRHRDLAYGRAGISIEPIVRVEQHLHAIRPDLDALIPRLHRLFGSAQTREEA